MTRLVVIGGNAAGMSAASKAKRRAPELEVEVLEAGPDISYSVCGAPYLVEGVVPDIEQLRVLSTEDAKKRGITVRTQCRVISFNAYTKEVVFQGAKGRDSSHYDKLLIATGTTPKNPFKGGDLGGVYAVRRLDDAARLVDGTKGAKNVAVVGGGYLGLEMAAAFKARGANVHLLTRGKRLLTAMDADITDGLTEWLENAGITVHLEAGVKGFSAGKKEGHLGSVEAKKDVAADAAIVAVGVQPATEFAVKSGVTTTKEGHILVDDNMHTNYHDVWAAGDCVAARHLITGRPTAMPFALPSNHMGRVAGDAIGASTEKIPGPCMYFPGVLGTAITHLFGLAFAQTGITQTQAKEEGIDAVAALIESKDKANYMPGAADMAVKVLAERGSGKLLGVQIACPSEAALRINAAAVAVQAGMKVHKLAEIETAYAPHFSPVYDPLIVAASECAKLVKK
ncbi:MAG: FAD-dependent oxidoreductase [bacterium]